MKTVPRTHLPSLLAAICFCFAVELSAAAQPEPAAAPKVRVEMLVTTDWLAARCSALTSA